MNTQNWHNFRMIAGIGLIALIGALGAVHVVIPGASWINTIIAILTLIEHANNGNTTA